MNIETKKENEILVIKPQDKSMEAGNSKELKGQIVDFINDGNKTIVLDLSKIEFMDSSGLGVLISLLKMLSNAGGVIIFSGAGDQVKKLFKLTRLEQVFQVFATEQEAINSLKTTHPQ